jgi:hypothetical protein
VHSETLKEGRVEKRLKRKMVKERGSATFIDIESGGWPVHTPCLIRRALNPERETPRLRLLLESR